MEVVRIAGTGSRVPDNVVPNDAIAPIIEPYAPDKGARWAFEKLGIRTRRTIHPFGASNTRAVEGGDEIDLACVTSSMAIGRAGVNHQAIDGLWYVSGTLPDNLRRLGRGALLLHERLGLRRDAPVFDCDAGCGGATHAIAAARHWLLGGGGETAIVVASNVPSRYLGDAEAYARSGLWLPLYIFGDGAGAIVLRRSDGNDGAIIASYTAVDPSMPLMEFRARAGLARGLFVMDARAVAVGFRKYARAALDGLLAKHPFDLADIKRFYFHQVNGRVLRDFVAEMGIPEDRVAIHVDRYGNLAAAATLVLLDEDVRAGIVGPGDLCLFRTVGAGAQYGAMLVRL